MKNVFIIFGIVMTAGILFSYNTLNQKNVNNYKNSDNIKISSKEIPQLDLMPIKLLIDKNNIHSSINNKILNLSQSTTEIISSNNSKDIIFVTNQNLSILFDCVINLQCKINITIAKTLIARHLDILKSELKLDNTLSKIVNWIVIKECSGLNNSDINSLALDLLFHYNTQNNGSTVMLEISSSYRGEDKVEFFRTMSEALLPDERKLFISTLKTSIQKDDRKTVELILKNLNEFRLSQAEILDIKKM